MKTYRFFFSFAIVSLLFVSACSSTPKRHSTSGDDASRVVAQVGSLEITQRELDDTLRETIKPLESQIYEIKRQRLNQIIEEKLWDLASHDRKITPRELQAKVEGDPDQFISKLWKEYKVKTFLAPPRFIISTKGSPSFGPENAPVTLIEYSDFECPFCHRFQPVLKDIQSHYPGKIRFVFKHLPLAFHTKANTAHLASLCANEQGKFWEYRDILFSPHEGLERAHLIKYASVLNLNLNQFEQCLDARRYQSAVDADLKEAQTLNVQGTPTFFVNGRVLSGAQPFFKFAQIIDDELRNHR